MRTNGKMRLTVLLLALVLFGLGADRPVGHRWWEDPDCCAIPDPERETEVVLMPGTVNLEQGARESVVRASVRTKRDKRPIEADWSFSKWSGRGNVNVSAEGPSRGQTYVLHLTATEWWPADYEALSKNPLSSYFPGLRSWIKVEADPGAASDFFMSGNFIDACKVTPIGLVAPAKNGVRYPYLEHQQPGEWRLHERWVPPLSGVTFRAVEGFQGGERTRQIHDVENLPESAIGVEISRVEGKVVRRCFAEFIFEVWIQDLKSGKSFFKQAKNVTVDVPCPD